MCRHATILDVMGLENRNRDKKGLRCGDLSRAHVEKHLF